MPMHTIQEDVHAIVPYSMHVSSRYLDLTKQKLELTRLPKENGAISPPEQWGLGTPKRVLEPLLDYWLEGYDWRGEEEKCNQALPQFRTLIDLHGASCYGEREGRKGIRVHFVHKRSVDRRAVGMLYVHSWPGSFVEVQRVIGHLVQPSMETDGVEPSERSFHVVCPSIPGFGFSDASDEPHFGVGGAAEVFAGLMQRLGYERYVVCGGGWGFEVAKALAMQEEGRVIGVFTWNPVFERPRVRERPLLWAEWQIAKMTRARWPALGFGYTPAEVTVVVKEEKQNDAARPMGPVMHQLFSLRPQTLAFSLCDSPVGLLAVLLDLVATQGPLTLNARPRSPFLDPGELELQDREYEAAGHERVRSDDTVRASQEGGAEGSSSSRRSWSPTDILNWTMMMWLPGAEAGLRWLRRAHIETSATTWRNRYCKAPLGISSFRTYCPSTPLMWGASSWPIAWVKRHQEAAEMPAWEAPEHLAKDMRECFAQLLDGRLNTSPELMV